MAEKQLALANKPILITGCARSGSSMIAGVLNICGAFGGTMTPPDRGKDGKGLYENDRIHELMVSYLTTLGADKLGQYPLPDVNRLLIPTDWSSRIMSILQADKYEGGPWMYKSSKSCLVWPMWAYAFPNAKWLIVRRRTGDIVKSCINTTFMKAFKDEKIQRLVGARDEKEGWLWWVAQHERRFLEMITEGVNCKVIWPHRTVYGDYEQLYETIDWLGLKWKSEVLAFIDPKLWKVRRDGIDFVSPALEVL